MDQAKALEKLNDENDYPVKMRIMIEELRSTKERNRALELKLREEERHSKLQQEHIVKIEE